MRNKRPLLVLDAEPTPRNTLATVPALESLLGDAKGFQELASTVQTGLHADACELANSGKQVKAARAMLDYLTKAAQEVPALAPDWKKQTSEALTVIEGQAVVFLRGKKISSCAKLIRVIDKTLESGIKAAQKRWHCIRALQLYSRHVYYDLATEKSGLALKNVQKAQTFERDSVPVLAMVVSRLSEAYIRSYQGDHRSAVIALREALNAQHLREAESVKQYQDPDWFFRVLALLLYNLAAESLSLHLRAEAIHYITKAAQVATKNETCDGTLRRKIAAFKEELVPEAVEGSVTESRQEEAKLPFIPGGQVAKSEPGKIVELTHESPAPPRRPNSHKLPKIKSLQKRESRENPYLQYVKEKGRYGSVPPSLRKKV